MSKREKLIKYIDDVIYLSSLPILLKSYENIATQDTLPKGDQVTMLYIQAHIIMSCIDRIMLNGDDYYKNSKVFLHLRIQDREFWKEDKYNQFVELRKSIKDVASACEYRIPHDTRI